MHGGREKDILPAVVLSGRAMKEWYHAEYGSPVEIRVQLNGRDLIAPAVLERGDTDGCSYHLPLRWADMDFAPDSEPEVLAEDEDGIRLRAAVTLPMAFVDDNGHLLSENGMFMKKGETLTLRRLP